MQCTELFINLKVGMPMPEKPFSEVCFIHHPLEKSTKLGFVNVYTSVFEKHASHNFGRCRMGENIVNGVSAFFKICYCFIIYQ